MKLERTLLFIFLFAVVTWIAVYQTGLEKQLQLISPDEVNRNVLFNDRDAIGRIEILDRVHKTETVLNKAGEQWVLESPIRYPADTRIVEGVAATVRMASRQPRLRGEKEWDEYGLAQPAMEIRVDVPKKKAETLYIGSQAPFGSAVFARWDSERGYMLLPLEMKEVFSQSVYNFREKRVFRMPAGEIKMVYAEMGTRSYQWRKDGGQWYWMEPLARFGEKISARDMNRVLAGLQGLYVKKFLDDTKKSKAELGFFIIHDRIKIEREFATRPEIFHFGNEVPLENAYYGFWEGEGTVFLIDRGKVIALIDLLDKIELDAGRGNPGKSRTAAEPASPVARRPVI